MGDVVFLTDDVFLHKPGKVLAIIDKINKNNKGKPLGATRNKIATRPGIKAWLARWAGDADMTLAVPGAAAVDYPPLVLQPEVVQALGGARPGAG